VKIESREQLILCCLWVLSKLYLDDASDAVVHRAFPY